MDDPLVLLSCLELVLRFGTFDSGVSLGLLECMVGIDGRIHISAVLTSRDELPCIQIQPMPPKQATCDICLYKMIVKENCKHEEFVIVLAISAKVSVYQPVVIYITICVCWSNRSFTSYCYMGSSCCATNHIP
ncbi:PREDICTED: uncharacterized protein LOC104605703 isoform X1 [Nelumbo nucifera]|uniref:Uncharacterized protein LOC104605703 isoform X1 n=1 Tax=Nelumbo nucifera TaxID=4432 RepID=A0A1U8ARA0_NELNU|nr:PREDICTED: uncharacterized protein LOC104605703 isoform X1 [Nelumbo nucifera]